MREDSQLKNPSSSNYWWSALAIPAFILLVSFLLKPSIYDIHIVASDVGSAETSPTLLYQFAHRNVFFTTFDLLHPEVFETAQDAVVVYVVPSPELKVERVQLATWFLQLRRLLALQNADGTPIAGIVPMERDTVLLNRFREFATNKTMPDRGRASIFPISQETTLFQRSGLKAIVFLAVATPPNAEGGSVLGFDSAFREAVKLLENAGIDSFGIPCIGTLTGHPRCEVEDWRILLDATLSLPSTNIKSITLGAWAKTPRGREWKAREFSLAWQDFQREQLTTGTSTMSHDVVRFAAFAVIGGLISAAVRAVPFSVSKFVAIIVLGGGALGLSSKLAGAYLPLWADLALPSEIQPLIKVFLALTLGYFMHIVVNFDPRKVLASKEGE